MKQPRPDSPGDVLSDLAEAQSVTWIMFERQLNLPDGLINDLLCGYIKVDQSLAQTLGSKVGKGASFWLDLQQKLDLWYERLNTQ